MPFMAKIQSKKNSTKKEVIIEKASKLFREKGFGAASMRDLAEHVGVEAASLYNHIQSKSEILQTICFKVANEFMTNLEQVETSNQPTLKKMEAIIRLHIRMMLDQYEYVYIADHEWRHLPEPYLASRDMKHYVESLRQIASGAITRDQAMKKMPALKPVGGVCPCSKSVRWVVEEGGTRLPS